MSYRSFTIFCYEIVCLNKLFYYDKIFDQFEILLSKQIGLEL